MPWAAIKNAARILLMVRQLPLQKPLLYSIQHAGTANKHSIQTALSKAVSLRAQRRKFLRQTEDLRKEVIYDYNFTGRKKRVTEKIYR